MVRDGKPKGFFYLDHPSMAATPSSPTPTRPRRRCTTRCCISAAWTGSGSALASASARVGVDAGYATAAVTEGHEERDIYAVTGYRRPTHRQGYFHKREFQYDAKLDVYLCPNGQLIPYRTTNREGYRQYHLTPSNAAPARCAASARKVAITPRSSPGMSGNRARTRSTGTGWSGSASASTSEERDGGTQLRGCQTAPRTPLREDARVDQGAAAMPAGRHCPEHQEDRPAAGQNRTGYVLFHAPGSSQRLSPPTPAILRAQHRSTQ